MSKVEETIVKELFEAGAHIGYSKSRRHASVKPYVFGEKNNVEILDLEKTSDLLQDALEFIADLGKNKKQVLFVGTKSEIRDIVKAGAEEIKQPYMTERWIGGTLTNFEQIKKRTQLLVDLRNKQAKGELDKYKKKERTKIAKEMKDLGRYFDGITEMTELPKAVFVIDSRTSEIAVKEANDRNIPVISLSNSDCDIRTISYPIVANDNSQKSVKYFVDKVVEAYRSGSAK